MGKGWPFFSSVTQKMGPANFSAKYLDHWGLSWELLWKPGGKRLKSLLFPINQGWYCYFPPENCINWLKGAFPSIASTWYLREKYVFCTFFRFIKIGFATFYFSIYYIDSLFTVKSVSRSIKKTRFLHNLPQKTEWYNRWKSRPKIYNLDRFSRFGTFLSIPGRQAWKQYNAIPKKCLSHSHQMYINKLKKLLGLHTENLTNRSLHPILKFSQFFSKSQEFLQLPKTPSF